MKGEKNKTRECKNYHGLLCSHFPNWCIPTSSAMSYSVIQKKLLYTLLLPPQVNSPPSSFHWYLLCLLGVWILKTEHVNILLQPAACQSQRRCQLRASSGSAVLGCVFASTRQKIHVITSEAREAVPPDRTACVGSTLSGLRWLIPHSTRGCVCECVCRCESVRARVYVCEPRQQAHQYLAPRLQPHLRLLAIPVLLHPNSQEIWALEGPWDSLTTW